VHIWDEGKEKGHCVWQHEDEPNCDKCQELDKKFGIDKELRDTKRSYIGSKVLPGLTLLLSGVSAFGAVAFLLL
jgi:hypothetical protein